MSRYLSIKGCCHWAPKSGPWRLTLQEKTQRNILIYTPSTMFEALKCSNLVSRLKLGRPALSDRPPVPDLEAGITLESPDTQSSPEPTPSTETLSRDIGKDDLVFVKNPDLNDHLTGKPGLIAEYITYKNRCIHGRCSSARQRALLYQCTKTSRLEEKVEKMEEQGLDKEDEYKQLMNDLVAATIQYDELVLQDKAIREFPRPSEAQHLALLNTLVNRMGLNLDDYPHLKVADDLLVPDSDLAHYLADRLIYTNKTSLQRIGFGLPTPKGRPRDISSALLCKAVAVLVLFLSLVLFAIPMSLMMLVPMSLAEELALALVTTLMVSAAVALASPLETLQHRILVVAAIVTVMLGVATLKAEFPGPGM